MSQDNYELGTLPIFNINKSIRSNYSFNFNWQSRQVFKTGEFQSQSEKDMDFVLNDFTMITSKSVGLNNVLSLGYMMRFENNQLIHRSIQQFVIIKRHRSFRIAHRFSTDQTFEEGNKGEYRFRYRISNEIPLNGQSVDKKEFYLKINNEYLNSLQNNEYDLEIRIVPMIGRALSNKNKLELGLDYRVDSFLESGSENSFWVAINSYFKL